VSTSEESCLSVCVRFRDASARARVSKDCPRVPAAVGVGGNTVAVPVEEEEDEEAAVDVVVEVAVVAEADEEEAVSAALGARDSQRHSLLLLLLLLELVLLLLDAAVRRLITDAEWEGDEELGVRPHTGVTVESCSWMSIMWSPSLMVRFSGAFPLKKSFT
jgi:hypothetical protein